MGFSPKALSNPSRPLLMGILNVTPDSFSDGGLHIETADALSRAKAMVEEGADIIDIGGESSRPGAKPVSLNQELDRVLPIIRVLKSDPLLQERDIALSIDTYKPKVMKACLQLGVDMVNDIKGLSEPGAIETCADYDVPVCIMHMQGDPETMQENPSYNHDIMQYLIAYFEARLKACSAGGIHLERVILDPGFGFGKTFEHNWQILRRLNALNALKRPILAGLSRKSMLGTLLDLPEDQRANASVAAAMVALQQGAKILRVHDVAHTRQAITIYEKACLN